MLDLDRLKVINDSQWDTPRQRLQRPAEVESDGPSTPDGLESVGRHPGVLRRSPVGRPAFS
ncbi:hypothetical protein [Actinoplanes sp. URMC 104]|uniref:hypothetical protein n=1 Tax=Actinoplanes sp. URMC 104 TaxID=3423409 RepID=UPI003F1BD647